MTARESITVFLGTFFTYPKGVSLEQFLHMPKLRASQSTPGWLAAIAKWRHAFHLAVTRRAPRDVRLHGTTSIWGDAGFDGVDVGRALALDPNIDPKIL